ncbi:hypothetical protein AQUCO_02100012v1 [Aquilegia coerulea]|uniref:Uncharacterized protein n=1 Tax=Aquilegia coerulea TaxID=218851 RepID=A0A2G5DF95_AQUCA|nr:hypothetical protein AQUCO_02100012v1 [Aquilegia coerulea]
MNSNSYPEFFYSHKAHFFLCNVMVLIRKPLNLVQWLLATGYIYSGNRGNYLPSSYSDYVTFKSSVLQ